MSNSSLVTYTRISPNRTSPRNHEIDTVSIHCYVGQVTAERGCNGSGFVNYDPDHGSSCNYVVGFDGSIGLNVEERDRSWCTSSRSNDHRAITIEVASDNFHPYKVTEDAYKALIDLLVDICQRNPKLHRLRWLGSKELIGDTNKQNMTVHRWFANKECPGDYLYDLHDEIANEVNARLDVLEGIISKPPAKAILYRVQTGAFSNKDNALALKATLESLGYDTYLVKTVKHYKVQVGAFANLDNARTMEEKLISQGFDTYITVQESSAVSDDAADTLVEGDKVRMTRGAPVWNRAYCFQDWVYDTTLYVREVDGDCITVSTKRVGDITGSVHKKYLTEI